MISLTTLVYNDAKLLITSINLICNTVIKINVRWLVGVRVIIFLGYQREGTLVYLVKQIPKNTDLVVSRDGHVRTFFNRSILKQGPSAR